MHELRLRLIERLCRLPDASLAQVAELLDQLERDSAITQDPHLPAGTVVAVPGQPKDWPHAPVHRLSEHGTFIVTASTLHKAHIFASPDKLSMLEDMLLRLAKQHQIVLEAWAVFSNHYHFVAHTTGGKNQLAEFLARLHYDSAAEVNRLDGCPGREVWFQYWDTQLTFDTSYLSRLNYVHNNAVKHGLVRRASEYPWCSAAWFERTATRAQVKTIYGFKMDRLKIDDDYEPIVERP